MIPFCPRTLSIGWDVDEKPIVEGSACIGSRCAAWRPAVLSAQGLGSCGLVTGGVSFLDPSRPTTRQTTPKPKSSETRA